MKQIVENLGWNANIKGNWIIVENGVCIKDGFDTEEEGIIFLQTVWPQYPR
jgi:hypothetical protein